MHKEGELYTCFKSASRQHQGGTVTDYEYTIYIYRYIYIYREREIERFQEQHTGTILV